jgi:NTP pyrophosphatase (non-canonical NTP hydrolase)
VLSKKYPGFCLYCNRPGKCGCPETKRPKPNWKTREVVPEHLERSLDEWQRTWKETYGEKNQKRGFAANVSALAGEAREIRRVKILFADSHMPSLEILENYLEELADFLARLSAVASLDEVQVDLEEAVWKRYGSGCPKCHKLVCTCTIHHASIREYYRTLGAETNVSPG